MDQYRIFSETLRAQRVQSCFFMATSFRTGSTLLGKLLQAQTGLSFHLEQFNGVPSWYMLGAEALCRKMTRALSPVNEELNGGFATKLMWPHRNNLARLLGLKADDTLAFLEVFPNPRFIHLYRRDKVAQAVSFHVARHRNAWDSRTSQSLVNSSVPYVFDDINRYYMHFLSFDFMWKTFFQAADMDCVTYVYEEIIVDMISVGSKFWQILTCRSMTENGPWCHL